MSKEKFIATLDLLFEQERTAIFDGLFDELGVISKAKNQMIAQIPTFDFSADLMAAFVANARRNQNLLGAAVRGIRMAKNRIQSARLTKDTLNTYDKSGKRVTLNSAGRSLEWRA